MNEPETHRSKWTTAITAFAVALLAFVYAYVVWFLALGIGGAGHGWGSASISCYGLALVPLASVAWVYRRTVGGRVLAIFTLVSAGVVDAYLVIATQSEGFEYVGRVWSAAPSFLFVWLILWLAWQIALTLLVCHRVFQSNRNA